VLARSQSTTAAVRQYEMNVNVTLLMTMTWAARMALAVVVESPAEGAPLGVDNEGEDEAGPVVSFDTRSWRPLYWCDGGRRFAVAKCLCGIRRVGDLPGRPRAE